jgi:hypothetical protein
MKPIASTRHTLILLAILAVVALIGALNRPGGGAAGGSHIPLYLGLIASEWLLFRYALVGIRKAGTPLETIVGDGWHSPRAWGFALVVGALAWLGLGVLDLGLKHAMNALGLPVIADNARTTAAVRPHGALETGLWVLLSISAGVCEEFVYRGYLLRQFSAWFHGRGRGLLASSILFGIGHAYQGLAPVLLITGLGLGFGAVALWTRRLAPGMVGHALMDIVSGLTGR